ncbi:hypothetical protein FPRO06_09848 [Fusarium proliferatum]|nr:hypothetical protein FPRO06_09848 [Fusarium proliferatum]
MALSVPLNSSDIDPFDEDARRQWVISYLRAEGVYDGSILEASHQQREEEVARSISVDEQVTQVGHLYFEFHVDKAVWQKTFKDRGQAMAPEWPWPESPNLNDMSQGLSMGYRQWRIDYRLPVDVAQFVYAVPTYMGPQPSLAKRQEIWDVVFRDAPHGDSVVGPFELALPRDIDFHNLVFGNGNEMYHNLCRLIGPQIVLTWTIVDNRASSLIVGINPTYDVGTEPLFVHVVIRRLWVLVNQWLRAVKIAPTVTQGLDEEIKDLKNEKFLSMGEVYFEFLCNEAVWMKTYHHRMKCGLAPEWPFKGKPGRHDLVLAPPSTIDSGASTMGCLFPTAALGATEEAQELSPVIPLDQPLVLVPSFRATTVMPWMEPFPSMDTCKAIWGDIGDGQLTEAVPGPFEVALPPWLDFNRLVLGEDRAVHNEIERLVSPVLTIAWRTVFGKPVSLIVGVDPKFDNFSASPSVRLEVRRLWQYVCHWVLFATKGHSTTLSDHIALLLAKEKLGLPMGMEDLEGLATAHFEAVNNLADSERNARVQHEAEEQLIPELHAILQQPPPAAREYLGIWIRLDMANAGMRLNFAFKYWVRVAIRSGKGVKDVLTWHTALSKEQE